ncbi:hypothetical protein MKW92_019859 [Papaver armeniacum]|nr:hypothetical protein MKW92_019859 [Papaver armeniacum]
MNSKFIIVCVLMTLLQVLNPAMSDLRPCDQQLPEKQDRKSVCQYIKLAVLIIGTVNNTRDVSNSCGSKLYKMSLISLDIKCDNVV